MRNMKVPVLLPQKQTDSRFGDILFGYVCFLLWFIAFYYNKYVLCILLYSKFLDIPT